MTHRADNGLAGMDVPNNMPAVPTGFAAAPTGKSLEHMVGSAGVKPASDRNPRPALH
jgi:hypothetical protein